MRETKSIRPQDILVLLRLVQPSREKMRQIDIGYELGISPSEVGMGLNRLLKAKLINFNGQPVFAAVKEFLIHGLKYFYPVDPGPITRGIPTAHSAPPMNKHFNLEKNENYVWPSPRGKITGQSIIPLYKSAVNLVDKNKDVYELLTLIDTIRVGRAREVYMAEKELIARLELGLRSKNQNQQDIR
jgi:hypothetical protein